MTDPAQHVAVGDRIILDEMATGRCWLVQLDGGGARKEKGLGVFDPARLEGTAYGSEVQVAGKDLQIRRPSVPDLHSTLRRKAQTIGQKDASRIVWELGASAGDRVLESGIGSGALTIALAAAVGRDGRVVVQELRDDFGQWAMDNLARAGLDGRVEVHMGDLTQALAPGVEGPFVACLLDQPEPWLALEHVLPVLQAGGTIGAYCPQVGQMEKTARALAAAGCHAVRCLELIERTWDIKERGVRPSFDGLGHTGFLVFARTGPETQA